MEENEMNYYKPILINLIENKYHYHEHDMLPAHDFVIKPLLEKCLYCNVYGIKNESELYSTNQDILIKDKGKYTLDTTKECIKGHEYLWNATGGKRGSIIIILKEDIDIFDNILPHTFIGIDCDIPIIDNPNTGNTISAIRKCQEEMAKGNMGFCLTQNNGLEFMEIYIGQKSKDTIIEKVMQQCKRIDTKNKH
jgi:hypothetical protein